MPRKGSASSKLRHSGESRVFRFQNSALSEILEDICQPKTMLKGLPSLSGSRVFHFGNWTQKKEVISNASGCLVDYYGHRLLLSVSHKSLADGNWAIEEGFDRDKGTRLHQVGGLKYVARGDWGTLKRDAIDFSYASVPSDLVSLYQEIDAGRYTTKQAQRTVFKETFETEPNPKELYAFSGQTRHSKENWFLCSTNMVVMGLTFERSEGDFHHFKLPFRHPGHDSFHGCGGAPIIDSEARVVALVCGGDTETDTVYGVSLKKMKPILDIETGRFVGA